MTHPPDLVEIVCARCGTISTAYLRPNLDHEPEPWQGGEGVAFPVCPECGAEPGNRLLEPSVLGAHPSEDG